MVASPRASGDAVQALAARIQAMQRQIDELTRRLGGSGLPDATVPATPSLNTSAGASAVYQSTSTGITKTGVQLAWATPANMDTTPVTDGSHFQIRYRTVNITTSTTWGDLAGYTWGDLAANTWGNPLGLAVGDIPPGSGVPAPDTSFGEWHYLSTGWDSTDFLVKELTPGITYEFQIRSVDLSGNVSTWSQVQTITTPGDTVPPSTPASPTVAGSRIAIQITHTLGKEGGGTFNLEPDLHHFEVHAQYEPLFTPSDATLLGKVVANNGMMLSQIPVVQTFQIESVNPVYVKVIAVDEAGNKSAPSQPVTATAELIDDAHISDLTVDKVTAGTIHAQWLLGGSIKTSTSGARMEADTDGLRLYDSSGTLTVDLDANDGSGSFTGTIDTSASGQRAVMTPDNIDGFAAFEVYDDIGIDHLSITAHGNSMFVQRVKNADGVIDGGKMAFFAGESATFGVQDISIENTLRVDNGSWSMQGFWPNTFAPGGANAALFAGEWDITSAANAFVLFGPTMTYLMNPVIGVYWNGATLSYNVDNVTTTGFGARWITYNASTSTWVQQPVAVRLIYWVFKTT